MNHGLAHLFTLLAMLVGSGWAACATAPDSNGHVAISDNVTTIATYAYSSCAGLVSVSIPSSVISIGSYAFAYASDLTWIDVYSVGSIGTYAFSGTGLVRVNIFGSLTSIGAYAFSYNSNLKDLNIQGTVGTIGTCELSCAPRFGQRSLTFALLATPRFGQLH